MDLDLKSEIIPSMVSKDELDQRLAEGLYGTPELKYEEKMHFLGEFQERILRLLTKGQVAQPVIYPEIEEALKDKRAKKLLINGDISFDVTDKYLKLAKQLKIPYTVVHNPQLKGKTGLVVIAEDAFDVQQIGVNEKM